SGRISQPPPRSRPRGPARRDPTGRPPARPGRPFACAVSGLDFVRSRTTVAWTPRAGSVSPGRGSTNGRVYHIVDGRTARSVLSSRDVARRGKVGVFQRVRVPTG